MLSSPFFRVTLLHATTLPNPQPYAYESAFAVRWLIQEQTGGQAELNYDPARGSVNEGVPVERAISRSELANRPAPCPRPVSRRTRPTRVGKSER